MFYYQIATALCCSRVPLDLPVAGEGAIQGKEILYYLYEKPARHHRASFLVTHPGQLADPTGDLTWLSREKMHTSKGEALPKTVQRALDEGRLVAVNRAWPGWQGRLVTPPKGKKQVRLLGLGNVGANCLLALMLRGGDVIRRIGIYDRAEAAVSRWQLEMNQIAPPSGRDGLPEVVGLDRENLFDCDCFIFAASAEVPEPGEEKGDVRLLQYEKNRSILEDYVRQAREVGFKGHFVVLSDPVEPLSMAAYDLSNRDVRGQWDGKGLLPDQVEGYGLGVMHGRALYEAQREKRFAAYAAHGRAYGRHGQGLVLAVDPLAYEDALSLELTERVEKANLDIRALGFKPYVAPGVSSGAFTLLAMLRGEWKYSSVFFKGIYFGCRNRLRHGATEVETLPLDEKLWTRILGAAQPLWQYCGENGVQDGG